jgi:hypothetical protein
MVVEVTPGEFLDRVAVLRVKLARVAGRGSAQMVAAELGHLESDMIAMCLEKTPHLVEDLERVHARVWDAENNLRTALERRDMAEAGAWAMVSRAGNDERHAIRRQIDAAYGEQTTEVKEYAGPALADCRDRG